MNLYKGCYSEMIKCNTPTYVTEIIHYFVNQSLILKNDTITTGVRYKRCTVSSSVLYERPRNLDTLKLFGQLKKITHWTFQIFSRRENNLTFHHINIIIYTNNCYMTRKSFFLHFVTLLTSLGSN